MNRSRSISEGQWVVDQAIVPGGKLQSARSIQLLPAVSAADLRQIVSEKKVIYETDVWRRAAAALVYSSVERGKWKVYGKKHHTGQEQHIRMPPLPVLCPEKCRH